MKYNPGYHGSVVRNYRRNYLNCYGRETVLTDEMIWNIQDAICAPTSEEQDEWVLDAMIEKENDLKLQA